MLTDKLDAFGWGGPIPNNITQAIDLIRTGALDVTKHCFKSVNVRMNI